MKKGHPNLQNPLHQHSMQRGQEFSTPSRGSTTPTSRAHSKYVAAIKGYTQSHDYNANPFAPLRCKVEAHVTPGTKEMWAAHTASGYYIGNAWKPYRCHEVYISSTKASTKATHV
ncbi:hypothetical protein ACHAW6_002093 [Cyclotella cf. meneghiniana]